GGGHLGAARRGRDPPSTPRRPVGVLRRDCDPQRSRRGSDTARGECGGSAEHREAHLRALGRAAAAPGPGRLRAEEHACRPGERRQTLAWRPVGLTRPPATLTPSGRPRRRTVAPFIFSRACGGADSAHNMAAMKTTVEIPDPLFRKAKARAAERGQTLKEFMSEALQKSSRPTPAALASESPSG